MKKVSLLYGEFRNTVIEEYLQQYCYLAPDVTNVDSVAELPKHVQGRKLSDRIR